MTGRPSSTEPPPLPDLEILGEIGEGAYGVVWLARTVTGVDRAVKVVRRDHFERDESFEREFEGIKRFEPISRSHPGFVQILHVGRNRAAGFYYYVMELADAATANADRYEPRTLASITGKQIPPSEVADLGVALAEALERLHANGLAHRDVKPANVIFVGQRPKLADIGMVAAAGQRSFVGTEGYVPPEGPGSVAADVFSLGKVLYELAMGRDRLDFPALPDHLPDQPETRRQFLLLNDVICRACAPEPKRRFASAGEMAEAMRGVAAGRGPARKFLSLWVAIALIGCLAAGLFALNRDRSNPVSPEPVPSPAPASATGSVKIISSPPGARVFLNEKAIGDTPHYIEDVPPGPVSYQLALSGYRTIDLTGVVEPGAQTLLGEKLEVWRPPVEGRLWKNSLAQAFLPLDGLHIGEAGLAERFGPAERPGREQVEEFASWLTQRERESGYLESRQFYRVAAPEEVARAAARDPQQAALSDSAKWFLAVDRRPSGRVTIHSTPAGARVIRNGSALGRTPFSVPDADVGEAQFELQLEGYRPATVRGQVSPDQALELSATLTPSGAVVYGAPWENSLGMKFVPLGDVLFAIWETRVSDYETYVEGAGIENPLVDFTQTGAHPIVMVSRDDGQAFCEWLTSHERTAGLLTSRDRYRLPTDAEWSRAAGLEEPEGSAPSALDGQLKDRFPWGSQWPPPSGTGNFAGREARATLGAGRVMERYSDDFPQTAPVGSFPPNALGIHDLAGNVWEWVETPYGGGGSFADWAVCRGGSWSNDNRSELWSSYRNLIEKDQRDVIYGFRVLIERGAQPD